jgi:hypothetical protein
MSFALIGHATDFHFCPLSDFSALCYPAYLSRLLEKSPENRKKECKPEQEQFRFCSSPVSFFEVLSSIVVVVVVDKADTYV